MSTSIGGVSLTPQTPRVIVPIMGVDLAAIRREATAIAATDADLVEWRADRFQNLTSVDAVHEATALIKQIVRRPIIATVRTVGEGGFFEGDADAYAAATEVVSDQVDAVDVELRRPGAAALIEALSARGHPVIASRHVVRSTPDEAMMIELLERAEATPAAIGKLAVRATNPADAAALLHATAVYTARATKPVITMAMGDHGVITRLIGQLFGSCATFATVVEASAPGQPSLAELRRFWADLPEHPRD